MDSSERISRLRAAQDARKKATEKELCRSIKLINIGGFIGENVENMLKQTITPRVIDTVRRYCEYDESFFGIAKRVDQEYELYKLYNNHAAQMTMTGMSISKDDNSEYTEWYLDILAKYETKRGKKPCARFFAKWQLDCNTKEALIKLNALEDRIYFLKLGLDGADKRSFQDIAELEEFKTSAQNIETVWKMLTTKLEDFNCNANILSAACEMARAEQAVQRVM